MNSPPMFPFVDQSIELIESRSRVPVFQDMRVALRGSFHTARSKPLHLSMEA